MEQAAGRPRPGRRIRLGLAHAVCAALALAAAVALVRLAPEPLASRLVAADQQGEAAVWHRRILRRLADGAGTFVQGQVGDGDREYLWSVLLSSHIETISLRDEAGRVFWSSDNSRVATAPEAGRGEGGGAPGATAHVEIERSASRVVAKIVHPVVQAGARVGSIDFTRDVTRLHDAFASHLRAILSVVAAAVVAMVAALSLALMRAASHERRAIRARVEAQEGLAAEQLRLSRDARILGELNEWLQSSQSLPELFGMVARFMAHILPGSAGSLYVYSNSRDVLNGAASWSGGTHRDHIPPEDCWGLRRGRTYAYGENAVDFPCAHILDGGPEAPPRAYVCIPILAHGETVGLMTLTAAPEARRQDFEAQRRLAQTCAEQISMAISNVRMRDALQHQAIRDPLTGLFNQRHMLDRLRRHIGSRATREVSVVSLDVDHFKRFNDNFGHDAGDMVLRAVGETLARHADGDDLACRVGGEEFALLLPGVTAAQAVERAERARHDVGQIVVRYGDRALPRVTVSVGVAHCPTHGTMPQEIIRAADDALYAAKGRGRNCVVLAGPEAQRSEAAAAWDDDLAREAAAPEPAPERALERAPTLAAPMPVAELRRA